MNDGTSRDTEIERILQEMLETDETITARAVARKHSTLRQASSITRNAERVQLLAKYQEEQNRRRGWRFRVTRVSKKKIVAELARKDLRISELEKRVQTLLGFSLATFRAAAECGGMRVLASMFEDYRTMRREIEQICGVRLEFDAKEAAIDELELEA